MEAKFVAPKTAEKKLNNIAKGIQAAVKDRESRSLHNVFTRNKNLNIELKKKLDFLNDQLAELYYEYNVDPQFMVLFDQVITILHDILKKYGITLNTPKTNKKKS
jgi:hypothetical protein